MQTIQILRHDRLALLFIASFLIAGAVFDFIFVGVFKVAWIIVYGTTYVSLGLTLESYIAKSRYKRLSKTAVISFLIGTALGHLTLVGQHTQNRYSMSVVATDPIQLKSPDFSDFLFLTSEKLAAQLTQDKGDVPVLTETISDYGCKRSFAILSVDGIDIQADTRATWTFRSSSLGTYSNSELPAEVKAVWPWCKIQFYRPSS